MQDIIERWRWDVLFAHWQNPAFTTVVRMIARRQTMLDIRHFAVFASKGDQMRLAAVKAGDVRTEIESERLVAALDRYFTVAD